MYPVLLFSPKNQIIHHLVHTPKLKSFIFFALKLELFCKKEMKKKINKIQKFWGIDNIIHMKNIWMI